MTTYSQSVDVDLLQSSTINLLQGKSIMYSMKRHPRGNLKENPLSVNFDQQVELKRTGVKKINPICQ